jgi:hypothetical protein
MSTNGQFRSFSPKRQRMAGMGWEADARPIAETRLKLSCDVRISHRCHRLARLAAIVSAYGDKFACIARTVGGFPTLRQASYRRAAGKCCPRWRLPASRVWRLFRGVGFCWLAQIYSCRRVPLRAIMSKRCRLADGANVCNRSLPAIPPRTTRNGENGVGSCRSDYRLNATISLSAKGG